MKVLILDSYSDNLFRIFFNRDSRMNIKNYYQQREDTDGSQIYNEKNWDIFVMSLFDLDKYFSQDNNEENIKNMKQLLDNANSEYKIIIDGLGEGGDIGMRWKHLFDFCDNVGIYPDKINLFLTTLNVKESYKSWKKSEEEIPFKLYDNDFLSFVYFGVNKFINRDNQITTMGGEYNRLYEKEGLFLKPNRQLRDNKILSLVANPMTHRVIVQNHLFKNQYDNEGLISFNDDLKKVNRDIFNPQILKNFQLFSQSILLKMPL